jgi:hypothetical protein
MTRLSAALRLLPAIPVVNHALTRLVTAAGAAYAAEVDGTARHQPHYPVTITHEGAGGRHFRQSSKRSVRTLVQTLHHVAELVPQRTRPAPEVFPADVGTPSLDTTMRRLTNIVAPPAQRFTRGSLILASNLPRQAAPANNAIGGFSNGFMQSPHARLTSALSWSVGAHVPGGLRTTIALLSTLLAPARARARSVAASERSSRSPVTSMLTRLWTQLHLAFSNYSSTTQLRALSGAGGALSQQPLTADLRRLDRLARKITSVATRPAGAASPNATALPRGVHLQPLWLRRLQLPESPKREVSPRRKPVFDRRDRSARASAAPTPAPAPSTINVAINVHGVANGDDFVRRHGYAIAQVLDQVMERRARRAF